MPPVPTRLAALILAQWRSDEFARKKPTMKLSIKIVSSLFVLTFTCLPVSAQQSEGVTHFAKDGLVFDYPASLALKDLSNAHGQVLVMEIDGKAQIRVVSRFDKITSAEQLAIARHDNVDSFVEELKEGVQKMDPKMTSGPAQIEIAGRQAPGVRIEALLDNAPAFAEIYSILLGQRLVIVTLMGSEKEIAATTKEWAMVRSSLQVGTGTTP